MSQAVAAVQKNPPSTGGATGKGWMPGQSGNPGGRPKGVASRARQAIGDDPGELLGVFLEVARDPEQKASDRISAAREYLDRAYGKAPAYTPVEGGDPLELNAVDRAIATVLDELVTGREKQAARDSGSPTVARDSAAGAVAA